MNYPDLLHAIAQRWRLVLGITLGVLLLVFGWTLTSPRQYQATASLLFDFAENMQPPAGQAPTQASQASALGTQADVIRSDQVASQVASTQQLAQDANRQRQWKAETGGRLAFDRWLAKQLLQNVYVNTVKNSNVLAITYMSSDAGEAALRANGFADAFVRTQLRLRTEPAKVYSDWFAGRIRDARLKLEAAQARLTAFQQRHGLVGGEKLDIELSHISDLTGQLAIAEAQAAQDGGRARAGGAAAPEVQMSATVTTLRSAVALKTAEVEQLGATLGPNHPLLQTARAALATLRGKLGEAVAQATRSLGASSASSVERVADLRQRLGVQRARILRLSAVQDELEVLQRDVNSAKSDYDAVTQSLSAARLRAQIPQTNVSILDRADAPLLPVSPNVPLRMLLGALLGLGLGLGAAAFAEWRTPYVRTAASLEQRTGVPTLFVDPMMDSAIRQRGAAA